MGNDTVVIDGKQIDLADLDVKVLRGKLAEEEKAMDGAMAGVKIDPDNPTAVEVPTEVASTFRKHLGNFRELKQLVELVEGRAEAKAFMDGTPGGLSAAGADAAVRQLAHLAGSAGSKTLGELYVESAEFKAFKDGGFNGKCLLQLEGKSIPELVRASLQTKDIYTASGGTFSGPAFGSREDSGIIERALRRMRVRDLFPNDTTTANLIEYIRVTNFVNNARPVGERENPDGTYNPAGSVFAKKPKSELEFTPDAAPVRTIAHVFDVHTTALEDEPRLRAIIDREALYGLRLEEDDQLLNGDGTQYNVRGLLNTPGIQQYVGLATDKRSAQVRRMLTRAILAYYEPTGVVFHPFDWEDVELEQDANGAYIVAVSVAIGAEKRLWRCAVVDTPAMPEGQVLVGSFGLGAKVWDRRAAQVLISTENKDNFERNAATIRAEERLALEVTRPESFVHGTLTAPAAA